MRTHRSGAKAQNGGGVDLTLDLDGDEWAHVCAAAKAAGQGDNPVGFVFDVLRALPAPKAEA